MDDVFRNLNFNFLNDFLVYWDLNWNFDYFNSSVFNDSVNNSFNDLRYLDNFLNNSRYNNNFLDDLFNFDDLWHFNHLFNDLINVNSNLFNSFNGFWHFDDSFHNYLNWIVNINIDNSWLFNFVRFNDFDNLLD